VTGLLAATWNAARLHEALDSALSAVASRGRRRPRRSVGAMVRERFTIQRMSVALGEVYRGVARDEAALLETGRSPPDDPARHQPRLRLAPAAARDPGDGLADRGERVVVAAGPRPRNSSPEFGFERHDLRLGRGSNPGVISTDSSPSTRATPCEGSSRRPGVERCRP
jgi:hypothetical protein